MLSRIRPRRRGDQRGSGTAIGVAVVFPMLMLVIVALRMLTDSARLEQGIHAAANQAARTAALCCHYTDGPLSADAAARAALDAAEGPGNRIECANDFAGDADIVFVSVDDQVVPVAADAPVPPGGLVFVSVTCRIPPAILGGYGVLGLDAERTTTAVASIDPFRHRTGA